MRDEGGFTLIEALVAMAVLGVGAVSLLGAVETHTRGIGDIEARLAARWVAENHLTAWALRLPAEASTEMLGRAWRIETDVLPTEDPSLYRIDVAVSAADGPDRGAVLAVLTGFLPGEIQ